MTNVSVLNVLLHGRPVGTLTNIGGDRTIFAFNEDHVASADRPTLGLGFRDEFGRLITEFPSYRKRVMPFFSNLLPEGRLRKYLAGRAGVNPERAFHLLWVLGKDLPGAITIESADAGPPTCEEDDPAEDRNADANRENILRFSLAGVQLKFSAAMDAAGGLTIPAAGVGGDWIVKLPSSGYDGVPENEFSMMTLARLVGIDVPPIKLIDIGAVGNLPDGIERLGRHAFSSIKSNRPDYRCNILPGFMMFSGSNACLIDRITSTPWPSSNRRKPALPWPMPCSPVQVPSMAMARSFRRATNFSTCATSAGSAGSINASA